uniref:Uncharacterized protein n=1 Tax=Arundo donax TaxID=35708 RepID=A0A0A8YQ71_ARUDO
MLKCTYHIYCIIFNVCTVICRKKYIGMLDVRCLKIF